MEEWQEISPNSRLSTAVFSLRPRHEAWRCMLELLMDRICPSSKTTNRLDVVLVTHVSVFSPSSELRSIDTSFLLPFKCVFHTAFLPLVVEMEQSFHTESLSVAKVECKAEVGLPFS